MFIRPIRIITHANSIGSYLQNMQQTSNNIIKKTRHNSISLASKMVIIQTIWLPNNNNITNGLFNNENKISL